MKHFARILGILGVCAALFPFSVLADAPKPPYLVEVFGGAQCRYNNDINARILNRLHEGQDLVLINCRAVHPNQEIKEREFERVFCMERAQGYQKKLGLFLPALPMIITNGILEAGLTNIDTGIDAGRSLASPVKIKLDRTSPAVLDIEIPSGIASKSAHGVVLLYAYAPTHTGVVVNEVDPALELDDAQKQALTLGKSVPFVTEKQLSETLLRPIVGYAQAAIWTGGAMNFSFPVAQIDTFLTDTAKLSFVAVLHEGDAYGPVIGVGEFKASPDADMIDAPAEPAFASFPPT